MAQTAVSIDANTFQFFLRNPRGEAARAIDPQDVLAFHAFCEEHSIRKILAHSPYTLNPISANERVREFALEVFTDDLARMEHLPHHMYNFHPGGNSSQDKASSIKQLVGFLNTVLPFAKTTMVLLETMVGRGSELGSTFEELATIIERVDDASCLGVCLDTCHVWAAGYDIVGDLDGVLAELDATVGLDRLHAIHLNDSLGAFGSNKDRHAKIGEGTIGLQALSAITRHPKLRHLPFYLETPNELPGYANEISRLRSAWI